MNDLFLKLGLDLDISLIMRLYLLVVARFAGASLSLPFFGGQLVPQRIRFGIPLFMALFLYPFVAGGIPAERVPEAGFFYVGMFVKEIFFGYCLGFVVSLPFHAVSSGGAFMDTQRGTTFATVVAPLTGGHASLLGQFLNLLFITLFLGLGGAHYVIEGIGLSYEVMPMLSYPNNLTASASFVEQIMWLTQGVFDAGVRIAAPVVVAMFLTDATLGIVNRAAPNIQVFFLGMGVKAMGGLLVVFVVLGFLARLFVEMMYQSLADLKQAIDLIAGG